MPLLPRRTVLAGAAATLLAAPRIGRAAPPTLRIGYQKYGSLLLLHGRGTLEVALRPLGWEVSWSLFTGGPQLLEALAAGAVDLGQTGEAPPVLSQAAGSDVAYLACNAPAPEGEAILVPADSPVRDVAGLKGRRVAFNKGSNVQYLVVRALQSAGLTFRDIQPTFLTPADGRAALERGAVDAWAIWDPFLAVAQEATGARVLVDATGLAPNRQFLLSGRAFADREAAVLRAAVAALDASDRLAAADPAAGARLLAEGAGLPLPIAQRCLARLPLGVGPMAPDVVADQQRIADTFLDQRLIPGRIDVAAAVWSHGS